MFYPNNKNDLKKCFRNTQKNPTKNPNAASPPCTSPDSYQLSHMSHAFPDLLFMTYYITWSVLVHIDIHVVSFLSCLLLRLCRGRRLWQPTLSLDLLEISTSLCDQNIIVFYYS